jgi:cytochrome oxidase assembly protein ShyY1
LFKILEFLFERTGGKALALGVLFASLFGFWQLDRMHQRNLGGANVRTEANDKAGELADKARAARDAVDDANAVDRLRERYCGDC